MTTDTAQPSPWIGQTFVVEICPECFLLHIGPVVPWHTDACSEPDLVRMVAKIEGPYTSGWDA